VAPKDFRRRIALLQVLAAGAGFIPHSKVFASRTTTKHSVRKQKKENSMKQLVIQSEIRNCLQLYIQGAITGKSESVRQVMHPNAQIFGYLDRELLAGPMSVLYDYIDSHPGAGTALKWAVTHIDETNGVGCARVVIENWHGHNFTDYFTLFRIGGTWKIMNKVFSHD
jgi:hypothetical protein